MQLLENLFKENKAKILSWVNERLPAAPLFASVDIRNSGFKIAHVDTNMFPAGFNNLSAEGREKAKNLIGVYIATHFPSAKKIALIPESFTRNLKYLENVQSLSDMISSAGFDVINIAIDEVPKTGFDLIILNNDLTNAPPSALQDTKIPIIPALEYGWYNRRKSNHFKAYDAIAKEFAELFGFDDWLINAYYDKCSDIDFKNKSGLTCLADSAEKLLQKIQQKYDEYNIKETPYLFIKADQGTYGMGIMTIQDPQEILNINKKSRHSMHTIKQGNQNTEVMLQEGIPTKQNFNGFASEELAYLVSGKVVDMLIRYNENQTQFSNLNSQGMMLANSQDNECSIARVIAMLAAIATKHEVNIN